MQPKSPKLKSLLASLLATSLIASSAFAADISLLNVSYDPTRELYQDYNAAFAKHAELAAKLIPPIGASDGLPVEASARPGTELITPSSGSPATRAVLQLPQPSILCARTDARRRNFRVSPSGAQVAKDARSLTAI